jgi:hypothetical protein
VLVTRERGESLLAAYDRGVMSAGKSAQYVGIKYSTLAYWLQRQQRLKEVLVTVYRPVLPDKAGSRLMSEN